MQIHNFDQRTPEWYAIRLGRITASQSSKLITATGKASTQQSSLVNELVHEMMSGEMEWSDPTPAMQRGIDLEPRACAMYELESCNTVEHVGFITHDTLAIGCSPDGLVAESGGLEIKCPLAHNHIGYLQDDKCPSKYYSQVQFSIWVAERDWWDFMSFHPDYPELIIRVYRDDNFISNLETEVSKVLEKCDNCIQEIKRRQES